MIDAEVLIIGGGAAGLTAAIELSQKHKVSVISKETIVDSSTWYAQGGIAVSYTHLTLPTKRNV